MEAYRGTILLLIAELCLTLSSVFGKSATNLSPVSGTELAFFRYLIGFVTVSGYMYYKNASFRPNNTRLVLLRGVTNTVAVLLFYTGFQYGTVTNANMLNLTYPVFVFFFSPFINGEKSRMKNLLWIGAALAGVYLVVVPDFQGINTGDVFALASGFVAGFGICYLREARKYDDSDIILFYLMVPGMVITFLIMLPSFIMPEGMALVYAILSGAVAVTGQMFLTVGYRYIEAATGAIVSGSRILFAGIIGVTFFADPLTCRILAGAVLILAALIGVSGFLERRRRGPAGGIRNPIPYDPGV
ncbi:MAG: DMT family transporter [Spirochaetes bacterium]|nr:MAG: DMT family transporter [Spirochaetota bacterium]